MSVAGPQERSIWPHATALAVSPTGTAGGVRSTNGPVVDVVDEVVVVVEELELDEDEVVVGGRVVAVEELELDEDELDEVEEVVEVVVGGRVVAVEELELDEVVERVELELEDVLVDVDELVELVVVVVMATPGVVADATTEGPDVPSRPMVRTR